MMAWVIGVDFHQLKRQMNKLIIIISLFLIGCNHSSDNKVEEVKSVRSKQIQDEIDKLLAEDKKNKMLELEFLEQIRIAQENNDTESFEFFFQEYVKVERLKIPEELKKEPNYFQGGLKVKY